MTRASINRSLPCVPRFGGVSRRWPNVCDTAIFVLHGDCLIHRETNRSFGVSRATKSPCVDPDRGHRNEPEVERSDTSGCPAPQGRGTPNGVRERSGSSTGVGCRSGMSGGSRGIGWPAVFDGQVGKPTLRTDGRTDGVLGGPRWLSPPSGSWNGQVHVGKGSCGGIGCVNALDRQPASAVARG